MPSNHRLEIIGHLGKDPEYKELDGDKYRTMFSVATTERHQKDGEWVDGHTEWFNIVAWGNQAKTASTLSKGDCVSIVGRLRTREYEKNGVKHWITEVKPTTLYKIDYQKRTAGAPPPEDEYDFGPPVDGDSMSAGGVA